MENLVPIGVQAPDRLAYSKLLYTLHYPNYQLIKVGTWKCL